jgi:DNA modification methylase
MKDLTTEMWPIEELKEWDKNPRKPTKAGIENLKKQITDLGQYKPMLINTNPKVAPIGSVAGGNMRLKALRELGTPKVWVIPIAFKNEEEMIKVALSDNDRAGVYVEDSLLELVKGLSSIDLKTYSVDIKEAPLLYTLTSNTALSSEKDDDIPAPRKTNIKIGDMFKLGEHRLLCGDATRYQDVEKLLQGEQSNMVFTDPPYNVDYGANKNPRHKIRQIKNDKQSPEEWKIFCASIFEIFKKYNKGDIYLWGGPEPDGMSSRLQLVEMGCHWSATIIWKKQQLVLTPANYQRMYEPCFYGWFEKSSFQGDRKQTEVWEIDRPLNSKLHPTMKPIELCEKGIKNSSAPDDIVLDLFGGSGSTLIACEKLNRKCRMMELDPVYCQVIIDRWEDFTGKKSSQIKCKKVY